MVPAAVIAESPSVIVVHEARAPQPKAKGGSSQLGINKVFDKRVRVTHALAEDRNVLYTTCRTMEGSI